MATKKTAKTPAKAAKPAAAPAKATKPAAASAKKAPASKAGCVVGTADKVAAAKAKPCTETACAEAPAAKASKTTKASAPKSVRVAFSVRAEVGSKVFLAGSFNGWDPTAKQMTDKDGTGVFTCTLTLPKGKHEYKFVINGIWCADPECTDWVQNDMGTLNSVKIVG